MCGKQDTEVKEKMSRAAKCNTGSTRRTQQRTYPKCGYMMSPGTPKTRSHAVASTTTCKGSHAETTRSTQRRADETRGVGQKNVSHHPRTRPRKEHNRKFEDAKWAPLKLQRHASVQLRARVWMKPLKHNFAVTREIQNSLLEHNTIRSLVLVQHVGLCRTLDTGESKD